jgi:hypothetical protein
MTNAQESTNGHRVFPPPCSRRDLPDQNVSKDSTDNGSNPRSAVTSSTPAPRTFPANGYHVPPELYAPKADSFHDTIPDGLTKMKLPDRCQFMFSDGRQCTMARSEIHPSLCTYHSDREEQLFGDPSYRCEARSLDLPELFSVCRDLTTAAGVNRALAQVFRLLAQRRISRQEAATFGHLAQLLLRSISLARSSRESDDMPSIAMPSQSAERRAQQVPTRGSFILSESPDEKLPTECALAGQQPQRTISPVAPLPPSDCISPGASLESTPDAKEDGRDSQEPRAEAIASNSRRISTYKNVEHKPGLSC